MSEETKLIKPLSFNNSKGLPKASEELDKKGGFIKWGAKNDYPFYLIDMFNGSAWHQGILKTKTYYVAGNGIEIVRGVLDEFLANKHTDFTIEELVKKVAFDYEMFDAFCVVGTWNKEGSRVVKWEHVDLDSVRTNEDESMYFISDDWNARKQSKEKTNFREIPPLDKNAKTGKFMIYYKAPVKQSREDKGIYPKPNYVGGLTAINTDVLISQYHLYEIQNGFKGGTIVNLANGQPDTEEEARAHRDAIKNSSTGVEHSNELIITFSDGQENAPTVVSLQGNDLADRYNMTEKAVQQNILVAHSVTSASLFGIMQEGSFNAAEAADLFEVWKKTYVSSRQESIEWLLNVMIRLSGFDGEVKLVEPNPFNAEEANENTPTGQEVEEGVKVEGEVVEDVAGTAMNGAQISSLVGIVEAVGLGTLTPAAAVEVILASFPTIDRTQAEKIVGLPSSTAQQSESPNIFKKNGETFRSADKDLKIFSEYGRKKDGFKVVRSFSVSNDFGSDDVARMEAGNFSMFFDRIGDIRAGLSDLDKNILELLKRGEDSSSITQAVDAPLKDVAESINKLEGLNLLVDGSTSDLGDQVLEGLDVEVDQFEVVYSYEKRPGISGNPVIPTTRDFCETLIERNLFYTREEINTISARVNRDVWRYRGGFYHNPDTGKTSPWCRHEWQQHLVIKQ